MTWFDYAVLIVIGISVLVSIIHGFVRELLALAAWIAAFVVAQWAAPIAVAWMPAALENPSLRVLAAFMMVFVAVLIVMTLLAYAISGLVKTAGLGGVDRLLGAIFGFVRGILIVLVGVLVAGLTTLPTEPVWRYAVLSPPFEALANTVKVWLPYGLSEHIHYN